MCWVSEMWWLIGSAPDFGGRSPWFESGISLIDPGALQGHCVIERYCKSQGRGGNLHLRPKKYKKNTGTVTDPFGSDTDPKHLLKIVNLPV